MVVKSVDEMKIAHIVNPVVVSPESDLFVAQPLTFKSMLNSKRSLKRQLDVELMTIAYEEDNAIHPRKFKKLPDLRRSVLDVGEFNKKRKLPLIKDILDAAITNTDSEYIIYTNSDISLMPYFYEAVADYLLEHDALVINRRTIDSCATGGKSLPFYFSQVGEKHPGFDCFVFKRSAYEQYCLGNVCIGANWIGRSLICNLLAFSENPLILTDAHLTFHLGDDRSWKTLDYIDYDEHNESCVAETIGHIEQLGLLQKHDLLKQTYDEFFLKSKDPDSTRPTQKLKRNKSLSHFENFTQTYRPSKEWSNDQDGSLNQQPIFVVGHPRSGTTLFQSLLATQVGTPIFPETHFYSIARTYLTCRNDLIQLKRLDEFFQFIESKLKMSESFYAYVTSMVEKQQLSPKLMFESIVFDQLCRHLSPEEALKSQWIEKTPDHAEHLKDIIRHYPKSKIIEVVRNPEKSILSRRKHFSWNHEIEWPLEKHVQRWIDTVEAVAEIKNKYPEKVYTIKFEDLVENKDLMKSVCGFLSIPYMKSRVSNYMEYSKLQNLEWESWKQDATKEISSEIALKVQEDMTSDEKAILKTMAPNHLKEFGYTL